MEICGVAKPGTGAMEAWKPVPDRSSYTLSGFENEGVSQVTMPFFSSYSLIVYPQRKGCVVADSRILLKNPA
jgi:hypothetical protein